MEFEKSIIEIIKERYSCRSYEVREIENETLFKFNNYIDEINKEANSIKINSRFLLLKSEEKSENKGKTFGTYGVISGASSFVIGIAHKDNHDALKFGFLFEKIILFATYLGLNTCWMGGTFKKSDFENSVSINENEFIPIVSPIGYKKRKPRIFESAMRAVIKADKRKPWMELFYDQNILNSLNEKKSYEYSIPLEMVRLGPSASNKQPWRIIKNNNTYNFFLSRTKGYGLMSFDMQKNDIGIAMCHFELTSKLLGLMGSWQTIDNIDTPEEWEYIVSWVSKV